MKRQPTHKNQKLTQLIPLGTFRQKYPQVGTFVKIVLYISRCSNDENELSFSEMCLDCSHFEYGNNIFQIAHRYLYTQDI